MPNADQTEDVKLTILALYGAVPDGLLSDRRAMFRRFRLDEAGYYDDPGRASTRAAQRLPTPHGVDAATRARAAHLDAVLRLEAEHVVRAAGVHDDSVAVPRARAGRRPSARSSSAQRAAERIGRARRAESAGTSRAPRRCRLPGPIGVQREHQRAPTSRSETTASIGS